MNLLEKINSLKKEEIVDDPQVAERFVQVYNKVWKTECGDAVYEKERINFKKVLESNNKLVNATNFSLFAAFMDLAVSGLSLEPGGRALCYIEGRNVKVGTNGEGKDVYEGQAVLTISGYGEIAKRILEGQIKYADNPVIVYNEDDFSFGEVGAHKVVDYKCNIPHRGGIKAAFIKITRIDGSVDYYTMFPEDWKRLEEFSGRKNKRWNRTENKWEYNPNALYTSNAGDIDTGFLCAKLIKHAFRSYPKMKIGKMSQLETEVLDDKAEEDLDKIYGDSFDVEEDTSKGVVVEESNDDPF